MIGCTLEIAGTVVARSEGGPLEAEYALFDASEIELRSTEYGAIREIGYRTTVVDALARLESAGATAALVRDVVGAVQAVARYYAPKRALPLLGIVTPAELLTADKFDSERRAYQSPLLDLARLATDCSVTNAASALQAAGLAAWLRETSPAEDIILRTAEYMAPRRPGERSIKRVSLAALRALTTGLNRLRERPPKHAIPDVTIEALMTWLRERGAPQDRLAWAELALTTGRASDKGPLADPRALAINVLIQAGRFDEAMPLIDRLEVETGRTTAVQYLRLRTALDSKLDPPLDIAERLMTLLARDESTELRLLTARAWSEAGNAGRAAQLAGDVMNDTQAAPSLRDEARKLVEVPAELVPDLAPREVMPPPQVARMRPSAPELKLDLMRESSNPMVQAAAQFAGFSTRPTPAPAQEAAHRTSAAQEELTTPRPFIMGITNSPPPLSSPPTRPVGPHEIDPLARGSIPGPAGMPSFTKQHSKAPTPMIPALEVPAVVVPTPPPPPTLVLEAELVPPEALPSTRPAAVREAQWMRGASQPPMQSAPPTASLPPILIPFEPRPPELAETLSLPPGLHGQAVPFDAVPKSVAEARVQFTLLTRSLGRAYRERYGVSLRTDRTGVEHIQTHLRERFTAPAIRNAEEASEVRIHGAFLSELLSRSFGAEWVDIAPSELGYWAMVTPSGVRIWPFGRILRFILQGHREGDLVSYYQELEGRMRSGR